MSDHEEAGQCTQISGQSLHYQVMLAKKQEIFKLQVREMLLVVVKAARRGLLELCDYEAIIMAHHGASDIATPLDLLYLWVPAVQNSLDMLRHVSKLPYPWYPTNIRWELNQAVVGDGNEADFRRMIWIRDCFAHIIWLAAAKDDVQVQDEILRTPCNAKLLNLIAQAGSQA